MSKIKKIINTVAIFIVIMFVICFMFSLYKVLVGDISISEIFSETALYFLYTVGYGALEGDSVWYYCSCFNVNLFNNKPFLET